MIFTTLKWGDNIYKYKKNPELMIKQIMIWGAVFSITVALIGASLCFINGTLLTFSTYLNFISSYMIKSSIAIFFEAVLGSLFFKYVLKNNVS